MRLKDEDLQFRLTKLSALNIQITSNCTDERNNQNIQIANLCLQLTKKATAALYSLGGEPDQTETSLKPIYK